MRKIFFILSCAIALTACGGNVGKQDDDDTAGVVDTALTDDTLDARGPGLDPAAGHTELDTTKNDSAVAP